MNIAQSQSIPVEKGWPLLGVLPNLFSGDPYEYLKNIMIKQGDLVQLNIVTQPVYLASHPDYLQRILRDNYQNYRKPDMFYKLGKDVIGNGLFTSTGDVWLRQRRMIQPHLHRKALVHLFADMAEAIAEILNRWELLAENNIEVELRKKMGEIVGNVVMYTMFGKEILQKEEITDLSQRVIEIFKYGGESLYSSMVPEWFPIPGRREFENNIHVMKEKVSQIVAKCRQEKESSASLIQMLINAVDEDSNEQMNEQQLFDEVMTIVTAGYETTATALTWFSVVLHQHPQVLEKLQAEINQVLGGRAPSFEDIPHLIYTRQVLMEVLRMYTVTPFLPRALNQADQLGNYHLPANALILVFYYGVHHNPRVWDKPEVFDPERFTPERIAKQHQFAYVPFSAGPRKCAGDEFALLEATLAMVMIIQKYNVNILPNQTFEARLGVSLSPRNGVKAILSSRTSV